MAGDQRNSITPVRRSAECPRSSTSQTAGSRTHLDGAVLPALELPTRQCHVCTFEPVAPEIALVVGGGFSGSRQNIFHLLRPKVCAFRDVHAHHFGALLTTNNDSGASSEGRVRKKTSVGHRKLSRTRRIRNHVRDIFSLTTLFSRQFLGCSLKEDAALEQQIGAVGDSEAFLRVMVRYQYTDILIL